MSRSHPLRKTWAVATIAWIGVIFFSSTSAAGRWAESLYKVISRLFYDSSNGQGSDLLHLLADKGFHVSLFLILAILLWKTIPDAPFKVSAILLFGLLTGSCSELLQALFPDRDPALRDVLINLGGTAAGVLLCLAVSRWLPRDSHRSIQAP